MERMLEATARAEPGHFWFRGLRRFAPALLDHRLPPNARILDCGAGTGYNLNWLSRYGWATGVELSPTGLKFAAARRVRVARATVTALPFRDGTFDLATSFDVLYCLSDDDERLTYTNMATLPLTLAVRGAQRLTGAARHASDDELATPVAPINRTLDAMLALEAWVMARGVNLPIGSSLMCLAQKPNHL